MENSFKSDYEYIINVLETAKSGIESVKNPEIEIFVTRLKLDLTRHINILKIRIGESPTTEKRYEKVPLRRVLGKEVMTEKGKPAKPFEIKSTPRDIEMEEIKQKVEDIYGKFATTESDQLFDTLSDIEIRAVAKKVGLPVTDKTPKRIDIAFIDQIKEAILKKHKSGQLEVPELDKVDLGNKIIPDAGLNTVLTPDAVIKEGDEPITRTEPVNNSEPINNDGPSLKDEALNNDSGNVKDNEAATDGNLKMLNELAALTNSAILEAYDENQIKEFALMADLEVTDKTKIDSKFITQLKDAIKSLNAGNNK